MASKSKRATAPSRISPKTKAMSSRQATASKAKPTRHTRAGRRTTLRVPGALEAEVTRTAAELDISGNEALLRLAQLGAVTAKRQRNVRRVIGDRHAAVARAGAETHPRAFPSPEEMEDAILVDRD
jgi:hypothetical protein